MKRSETNPHLSDEFATRIATRARWGDFAAPVPVRRQLETIVAEARTGHGLAALFAGAGGTGKTLAAQVVAGVLDLDLLRVDLAAFVSKFIGETEKQLSRLFEEAETSGAVLLFDEADALFGKRTEVRDANDRFANIEAGYLLQRLETHRGLVILATSRKANIDPAFLRRLRFVVDFPKAPRARSDQA